MAARSLLMPYSMTLPARGIRAGCRTGTLRFNVRARDHSQTTCLLVKVLYPVEQLHAAICGGSASDRAVCEEEGRSARSLSPRKTPGLSRMREVQVPEKRPAFRVCTSVRKMPGLSRVRESPTSHRALVHSLPYSTHSLPHSTHPNKGEPFGYE